MPRPLDPDKRKAILADIKAGKLSRNAIAKQHGVSSSTVTLIARQAGEATAFDRSKARAATRAREVDLAAIRADLAVRRALHARALQDAAERETAKLTQPTKYWDWGGKEHSYDECVQPEPHAQDRRAMMATASQAIATSLKLVPADTETPDAARSLIGDLAAGLQVAYEAMRDGEGAGDAP